MKLEEAAEQVGPTLLSVLRLSGNYVGNAAPSSLVAGIHSTTSISPGAGCKEGSEQHWLGIKGHNIRLRLSVLDIGVTGC